MTTRDQLKALAESSDEARANVLADLTVDALIDAHLDLGAFAADLRALADQFRTEIVDRVADQPYLDTDTHRVQVRWSKRHRGLNKPEYTAAVIKAAAPEDLPALVEAKTTKTAIRVHGVQPDEYYRDPETTRAGVGHVLTSSITVTPLGEIEAA